MKTSREFLRNKQCNMNLLNQILISAITVLGVIIWIKIIFKKEQPEDLIKEFKSWKGTRENFIRFKQYQYEQSFKFVFAMTPFITFAFGLVIGFLDKLISILGTLPAITILLCFLFLFSKYTKILGNVNKAAIDNMKKLLEDLKLKEQSL